MVVPVAWMAPRLAGWWHPSMLVVARLVAEPGLMRLGGEVREVTIMFTDLANFTTLSERLSAEQTVELLSGYFDAMTPIIHASGGAQQQAYIPVLQRTQIHGGQFFIDRFDRVPEHLSQSGTVRPQ